MFEGDPHGKTYDGIEYDFHGRGEYIASKSLDDDFEVQVRLVAWSQGSRVSFVRAVALRFAGHNVMIDGTLVHPLMIDGELVELEKGYALLTQDSTAAIARHDNRYSFIWADGTNVHVDVFGRSHSVFIIASEAREGRLVGLLGNADRDVGSNDFKTRQGRQLGAPPPMAQLYDPFGDSWRIFQEESLFTYGPDETTETFTDRSGPTEPATLAALSPQARATAEARCRAAGVTERRPLESCTIDLGYSGDEMFIASALSQQLPPELVPADEEASALTFGNFTFPLGSRSFADRVVAVLPGGPAPHPDTPYARGTNVLGIPDYAGNASPTYLSLGSGGSVTVAFTDNVLVDVPGPDLVVFEIGGDEGFRVSISEDGITFVEVGEVSGGTSALDIASVARPGARYTHVRLTDDGERRSDQFTNSTPGADIDAIGVLGAESR